jgi:hypothetical protein
MAANTSYIPGFIAISFGARLTLEGRIWLGPFTALVS